MRDPEASEVTKTCAVKQYIVVNAENWFETHLTSCRSHKRNNHLGKRLDKMNKTFDKVFGCELETQVPEETEDEQTENESESEETQSEETGSEENESEETQSEETEEPIRECGCYDKDEEILIESNDKCILDLGESPGTQDSWTFSFELKVHSLPTKPTDPPFSEWYPWYTQIIQGMDCF